jgi:hypothetical protein
LFSRNRLNVAISRAQYRAYLVRSPRLLDARCRTIEQMRLANALCRLVEQAEYFEARARRPAAAARDLETQLKDELGWIVDVHPVVVLWAQFPAGEAALGGVAVVRGDRPATGSDASRSASPQKTRTSFDRRSPLYQLRFDDLWPN